MSYQNPQILYFLFAIAIPIIIHLFNLRKHKVVYFSNITFLKEIQSEKKKRNSKTDSDRIEKRIGINFPLNSPNRIKPGMTKR